jgi:tetratricopeptide (TPR) repeat protein
MGSAAVASVRAETQPLPRQSDSPRNRRVILSLILIGVILAFYSPVAHNGFAYLDDSVYFFKNSAIHNGITWETIKWSATTFYDANWHPLTWLSHALDYQLFGLNPAGHHYVSLLFHAGNAVLLFLILEAATGLLWPSVIVAAFFGLHPLSVESVAWAAERKNVLSMFFCLLALRSYTNYARFGASKRYAASLIFFVLGLMAKPQIITLPILLFLWDYWPLGRLNLLRNESETSSSLRSLIVEKVPFLVFSGLSAAITMLAQHQANAVRSLAETPFSIRMENSIVAYARYVSDLFWPAKLAPMYPHPGNSLPLWQVGVAGILLIAVTVLVIWQRERRFLLAGWFWFLLALLPMIGLVQVGEQARADRYMYLPILGLLMAIVWGCREVALQLRIPAFVAAATTVAVVLVLGALTHYQLGHWHDGESLWRYTLRVTERNYMAHVNLAMVLAEQGRADEAITEFRAAENLHAYSAPEIMTLGDYEQNHGHLQGAIEQYIRAAGSSTDPAIQSAAWDRTGATHLISGNNKLAQQAFENSLAVKPNDPNALASSAMLAQRAGNFELAVRRLVQLVKVAPSNVSLLLLAGSLRQAGRDQDAHAAQIQAQKVSPDYAQAQETAKKFAAQFGVAE